jgi:hypothetical protein
MQALRKPNRLVHAAVGKHNFGIFPNFVPSIPDDNNSLKKEANCVLKFILWTIIAKQIQKIAKRE